MVIEAGLGLSCAAAASFDELLNAVECASGQRASPAAEVDGSSSKARGHGANHIYLHWIEIVLQPEQHAGMERRQTA